MTSVKLKTVPFSIDPEAIALGVLDMFSDDELTALRFGMLPAGKMGVLERALESKFRSISTSPTGNSDALTAVLDTPDWPRRINFSMKKLVAEAMRLVTLAMYEHGNLVV